MPTHSAHAFRVVLLAAGKGSRLGGMPKSLFKLDGQSLLERQIQGLNTAGATHIVVVTGFYYSDIEAELERIRTTCKVLIEIVRHPHPEEGQQTSVRLGLRALTAHGNFPTPVMIALADQPLMQATDFQECLNAFHQRPPACTIVYPVFNGQRGNPVILDASTADRVLDSGLTCRDFINVHSDEVHRFSAASDHFIFDIDHPQDLEKFALRTGIALEPPAFDPPHHKD